MSSGHESAEASETPLKILQKRLARAEITVEQCSELKGELDAELRNEPEEANDYILEFLNGGRRAAESKAKAAEFLLPM